MSQSQIIGEILRAPERWQLESCSDRLDYLQSLLPPMLASGDIAAVQMCSRLAH